MWMLSNLKLLRKEYGVSQQLLADTLGISQQSVNQYENRDIEPDIATLSQMADYFETSIDYIVGRTDIRRKIERTLPYYLNDEEGDIVKDYRRLSVRQRRCVTQVIDTLLDK